MSCASCSVPALRWHHVGPTFGGIYQLNDRRSERIANAIMTGFARAGAGAPVQSQTRREHNWLPDRTILSAENSTCLASDSTGVKVYLVCPLRCDAAKKGDRKVPLQSCYPARNPEYGALLDGCRRRTGRTPAQRFLGNDIL